MNRIIQLIPIILIVALSGEAQVINAGVGGNTTKDLLIRLDADVLKHKPDLVILMVGTNDMLNSRKMISYDNYSANLSTIVKKLKNNNAKVILMSPPTVDSHYLFERHNSELYQSLPNEKLDTIRQIIARTARESNVYFIDIFQRFQDMLLPNYNKDLFIMNPNNSGFRDGVHPTRLGYFFIAENVFQFLQKSDLLEKGDKIICFGDSITYGSKVKGSGTVVGETYPAYLLSAIIDYYDQ